MPLCERTRVVGDGGEALGCEGCEGKVGGDGEEGEDIAVKLEEPK